MVGGAWVRPENQDTTLVSAGLETGLGRDTDLLGVTRLGWGVISCRSGEGSVLVPWRGTVREHGLKDMVLFCS